MNESTRVLIALVAALVLGAAIAASGNATLLGAADIVAPIGTLWVNAIRMTVIPLIVSLLITGVASASDGEDHWPHWRPHAARVRAAAWPGPRSSSCRSSRRCSRCCLASKARHPPLPPGAAEAAGQVAASGPAQSLGAWIVSLVPTNPIAAAANGAIVPLIVFSLLLGLAIAHSPHREPSDAGGLLQGVRRRDARAGALGDRRGADRRVRAGAAARGAPRRRARRGSGLLHRSSTRGRAWRSSRCSIRWSRSFARIPSRLDSRERRFRRS